MIASRHYLPPDQGPVRLRTPPRWLPRTESSYTVGVDLGQAADYTAIAILERRVEWSVDFTKDAERHPGPPQYLLRHLERLPLHLPYPDQAAYVARLIAGDGRLRGAAVIVDASGVGRPVVDLLRDFGLRGLVAVTITAGDSATQSGGDWRISKLQLISRLQARLHDGSLKIAKSLPLAAELGKELADFRVNYNAMGYTSFSARSGRHDDLVLCLALAVWSASAAMTRQVVGLRGL